jgi:hypothetical protein
MISDRGMDRNTDWAVKRISDDGMDGNRDFRDYKEGEETWQQWLVDKIRGVRKASIGR